MSLFITRPSTHSSVLPSVHPSAKFAPLVLAGVGLLVDPERRYMAPWSKRRRHSLDAAGPLPRSHDSAALLQATRSTRLRAAPDAGKTMSIRTATGHAGARRSSTSSCGCCHPSAPTRSTARWCSEQPLRRWRPCCHPTPASTLTALVPVRAHLGQRWLMLASGRRS